ncbi:MAG: exosortase/archaeosortase family protein [Planctomycetes bacterium]|nr:exosortase/archaeosortase family protein [Planctomycetota bacterium]
MTENIVSSIPKTQGSDGSMRQDARWSQFGIHKYIKTLILGGLFFCLFNNEIKPIVHRWQTDGSWSHGFLIPFFSLYFINQSKTEILNLKPKPNYLGLFFLICGILFYPLNVVHFQYGYLNAIIMIATLGAMMLFLGGWALVKYTWLPIVYLIFAVPLPQRYYVSLTMPMRLLATKVTTALLNLVNELQATASGVIIEVVYKGQRMQPALNVAEACSGMRLLMAFLALGVAMAYLHYRPAWQRIVLLASIIPIAIFCNIIRVTVTGFIYVLIHPKYAQGIYHDMLGLMMLPLAFGLYGLIAWFMSNLFVEEVDGNALKKHVVVRKR